jgi:hypothetical protein
MGWPYASPRTANDLRFAGRIEPHAGAVGGRAMRRALTSIALAAGTVIASSARSDEPVITFLRVIDEQTLIPFTPPMDTFTAPANSAGFAAFAGTADDYSGVFHNNAISFTKFADTDTPVPDGTGTFRSFGRPSIDQLRGAFAGLDEDFTRGIYASFAGPIPTTVVAEGDPVPDDGGTYRLFFDPSIDWDASADQGLVTFRASNEAFFSMIAVHGAFHDEGHLIAMTGDPIPNGDGATFTGFSDPVIDAGLVAFRGADGLSGHVGTYTWTAADGLDVVADLSTPIPDGEGNFTGFGALFINGIMSTADGDVAFRGDGADGQSGVYARIDGTFIRVADTNTEAPGGGTFTSFQDDWVSIDDGRVAFVAFVGVDAALYLWDDGEIHRVIGPDDVLDNRIVANVAIGPQALSGPSIAFRVIFGDGGHAVYLALVIDAPEIDGDIDGSGIVNVEDLLLLLGAWGDCADPDDCPEDLNGDGVVNVLDLLELLASWGGGGSPDNDECSGAIDVDAGVLPFTTIGATTSEMFLPNGQNPGFPSTWGVDCDEGSGYGFENDIWFRYVPETYGVLTVSTCPVADFDTRVAVYRVLDPDTCGPGSLEGIMCNDDSPTCETLAALGIFSSLPGRYAVTLGDELLIRVGSREPGVWGSGVLLIGIVSSGGVSGATPTECIAMMNLDPEVPGAFFEELTIDLEDFAEEPFDITPGCPPQDPGCEPGLCPEDSIGAWFCFIAPSTGVFRAQASSTWYELGAQFVTAAVFDLDGTLLWCDVDEQSDFLPPNLWDYEVDTYWPAVGGQRYWIRVGLPEAWADNQRVELTVASTDSDACGWPFAGPCFSNNEPLPGCDDGECCDLVCSLDPYCCNIEWDQICAQFAMKMCEVDPEPACLEPSDHSCYAVDPVAGCENQTCCETVCQIDPFCCDFEWDELCVARAVQVCISPPCPTESDQPCDQPSIFPGCSDDDCCGIVCDVLPYCCDVEWNSECVELAKMLCELEP